MYRNKPKPGANAAITSPTKKQATPKNPSATTSKKTPASSKSSAHQHHNHYEFPKHLNTYLGQKGYTILKSELNEEHTKMLIKKLTVIPKTNTAISYGNAPELTYPVYRESSKKFYIPRYFGIKHFGEAKEITISEGDNIDVPFVKSLRENQLPVVDAYMAKLADKSHGGGLLELPCAYGKCLARDTEVLMFDGTIKPVQDIAVGDLLMGDDSKPRTVKSIARGREPMIRFYNHKCNVDYTVNASHILSLKNPFYIDNDVSSSRHNTIDICAKEYIQRSFRIKNVKNARINENRLHTIDDYKGYRVPIDFRLDEDATPSIIPYNKNEWKKIKIASRKTRFGALIQFTEHAGGIYDSEKYILDGVLIQRMRLTIICTDIEQIRDVLFIARSLGFHCSYQNFHICIYSTKYAQLNMLKPNVEQLSPQRIDHVDYNLTYDLFWKILPEDDYYGFEIEGTNRRFLLADFTVTHNTVLSLNIISVLKKKTLVIVNKEFLMNQWIERIAEFLPSARVGRIQSTILDIENKDIVLGMLQSISMKDYDSSVFDSFGLTIIDEVHHISSEVFSRALFKIVSKYMLGLSATMERKDGTTDVFKMFLGDVAFKGEHTEKHRVCVRAIEYVSGDAVFNEVECDFRGQPKYSTMISKLCAFVPRSDFIVRIIRDLLVEEPDSQIMILAHNRSVLEYLHDTILEKEIATVGYYLGGMKERDLKITESKQIVIATYAMAAEALDIKTLSCLVMATPKTDIVQSVGRILRMKHRNPRVIDIVDKHDIFQRQWNQRKRFYRSCNYRIRSIDSTHYLGMKFDWDRDKTWKWVFEPAPDSGKDSDSESSGGMSDEDMPAAKCMIDFSGFDAHVDPSY